MDSRYLLSLICVANAVCILACSDGTNGHGNLKAVHNAAIIPCYSNVRVVEIAGERANIELSKSLSKRMLEEILDKRNYKQDIPYFYQRPLFICSCGNYKIVFYMTHVACYDNKTGEIIESKSPLNFDKLKHCKEWHIIRQFATEMGEIQSNILEPGAKLERDSQLYRSIQRRTGELIMSFLNSEQTRYQ